VLVLHLRAHLCLRVLGGEELEDRAASISGPTSYPPSMLVNNYYDD